MPIYSVNPFEGANADAVGAQDYIRAQYPSSPVTIETQTGPSGDTVISSLEIEGISQAEFDALIVYLKANYPRAFPPPQATIWKVINVNFPNIQPNGYEVVVIDLKPYFGAGYIKPPCLATPVYPGNAPLAVALDARITATDELSLIAINRGAQAFNPPAIGIPVKFEFSA